MGGDQIANFDTQRSSAHKIAKRERAFNLVRLESELEREEDRKHRSLNARLGNSLRDEAINDELCQSKCNERLKSGLDMVKAHMAFGSIGVPPVSDSTDLALFCRLDTQHDRCLQDCGFTVQFNMRDYVCKRHYEEMNSLLRCFAYAAPTLKRQCGEERCGPYGDAENTILGRYAHRCRMLVCDIMCTRSVLLRRCGLREGTRATKYLFNYTREQVNQNNQLLT
ncbi:hypothetical protein Tcan_18662 [Toxocara canis]|uniref:Uncharacterized protein n=1 Tax=Toxocara canis TaxID=6265 RepID=A0A0B2VDR8_TOXCA|nr:hypothetical protein Tcan_18662 [Toxocara canis]